MFIVFCLRKNYPPLWQRELRQLKGYRSSINCISRILDQGFTKKYWAVP